MKYTANAHGFDTMSRQYEASDHVTVYESLTSLLNAKAVQ